MILKDKPVVRQAAQQLMRASHDRLSTSSGSVNKAVNQFKKKVALARSAAVISKGIYDDSKSNETETKHSNLPSEGITSNQHILPEAEREINKFIKTRFRTQDQLSYLDLSSCVFYDDSIGLMVKVERLHGMQSKGYLNVFSYIWSGNYNSDVLERKYVLLTQKRNHHHRTASPVFMDSQHVSIHF